MSAIRKIHGQEAMEVGMIAAIALVLSLGAVVIFGGNIQKVFQNDDSPIIVSAQKMQNSSDAGDVDGANSRTNVDKSLVSEDLITRARTDTSIGSAIGHETTGAAGGDFTIGGTYDITDLAALNDGDVTTTGNALLDAALAAKNTAIKLINNSISAASQASILAAKTDSLVKKADQQQIVVDEMQTGLDNLLSDVGMINAYLENLVEEHMSSMFSSVSSIFGIAAAEIIDLEILATTDTNLISSVALLSLNTEQQEAQDLYDQMQDDYEAGWTTVCSGDPPECTDVNTSGITTEDLNNQLALVNQFLSDIEGQAAALDEVISDLYDDMGSLSEAIDDAVDTADDLRHDAMDTAKEAFRHGTFWGCWTLDDYIARAQEIVDNGASDWRVKDFDSAQQTLSLLKQAKEAFLAADDLKIEAQVLQADIAQKELTLDALLGGATSLTIDVSSQNLDALIAQQESAFAALSAANAEIALTLDELIKMEELAVDMTNEINTQQSYLNTLSAQAITAATAATDAQTAANSLQDEAEQAVLDANALIDGIVCYDYETDC
ncbi:MAG: hypothetical protein AB1782_00720 [Cyanobacteriota bacterium]